MSKTAMAIFWDLQKENKDGGGRTLRLLRNLALQVI